MPYPFFLSKHQVFFSDLIKNIKLIFFIFDTKLQINDLWKYFLLGLVIAGLIAAVFFVPFLHFSPNFEKYYDPDFFEAQPLKYIPFNYVIDSYDFYKNDSLNKLELPKVSCILKRNV